MGGVGSNVTERNEEEWHPYLFGTSVTDSSFSPGSSGPTSLLVSGNPDLVPSTTGVSPNP